MYFSRKLHQDKAPFEKEWLKARAEVIGPLSSGFTIMTTGVCIDLPKQSQMAKAEMFDRGSNLIARPDD